MFNAKHNIQNQTKPKQSKTKLRSKPNNPVQSGIKSRWMQADNKVHWLLFEWNFRKRIERSEISKKYILRYDGIASGIIPYIYLLVELIVFLEPSN